MSKNVYESPREHLPAAGFARPNRIALALRLVVVLAACLFLAERPARAHRMNIFATAEGNAISGRAYFTGGGGARNVTVRVLTPGGRKLGETKTNHNGEFIFAAKHKCDHVFVIEIQDGHGARFTVKVDELPDDLAPLVGAATGGAAAAADSQPAGAEQRSGRAPAMPDVEKAVAKAVGRQIAALRRQIDRMEQKVRIHDILGGVGYLVGMGGIAFYFLGARKIEKRRAAARPPGR